MKTKQLLQLWFAQATAFTTIIFLYALCVLGFEMRVLLLVLCSYMGAWIVKLPEFICHSVYVQYNTYSLRKRAGAKLRAFRTILLADLLVCIGCGVLVYAVERNMLDAKLVFLVFLMSDLLGLLLMPRNFDSY